MNTAKERVNEILGEKKDTRQSYYELQDIAVHVSGIKRAVTEEAIEYILSNLNSDFQFIETIDSAAKNSGLSPSAIERALKGMLESDPPFLEKKAPSAYQISTKYLFAISEYNTKQEMKRKNKQIHGVKR